MNLPPFTGARQISVILPSFLEGLSDSDAASVRSVWPILEKEASAIARELGAPIERAEAAADDEPRWLVGPASCNPCLTSELERLDLRVPDGPYLLLDRPRALLVTDAQTASGVWETFSLLRSLARLDGGLLAVAECATVEEAISRVREEVGDSYPSFAAKGIDWDEVCARHVDRVRRAVDAPAAMQAWLADLGDTHTWVRPARPFGWVPYEVIITPDRRAVLARVPVTSAGWEAGARAGFTLEGEDAAGWWDRTAASPHARPHVAGRRLLVGGGDKLRSFSARSSAGTVVEWSEPVQASPPGPPAAWRRLRTGAGYLRIERWSDRDALESIVDEALEASRRAPGLVVDLRGNGGGDIALAHRFRDRFLREAGAVGSIRYSVSHGVLSEPEPLLADPAPEQARWGGPVRFLTDALTYSSSEDALLGLQGLEHVEVVGEPSGGGSGRMRVLRLVPGWVLTTSTALTFDRAGRCIEGAGIHVDRYVGADPFGEVDRVLEAAASGW